MIPVNLVVLSPEGRKLIMESPPLAGYRPQSFAPVQAQAVELAKSLARAAIDCVYNLVRDRT